MSHFNCVGLVGRQGSEAATYSLRVLIDFLHARHVKTLIDSETAEGISHAEVPHVSRAQLAQLCDLIIVVGGDGSVLSTGRAMRGTNVPLLGINRGRLGFLTDISPEDIETRVGAVLDGYFLDEQRFLLDCQVLRDGKVIGTGTALNDVVLHPGQFIRMIEFELYIGDQFVYRQRSDGLIISTPTGSTAYALSGGGPIMHPSLDALVLVPMNPHTLSSRPIVVGSDSEIRIVVGDQREVEPHVTCDGQTHIVTQEGDVIVINKKAETLRLIHPHDHDFYAVCRSKLGWAMDAGGKIN
jgi:NAD+ kinase